MFMHVLCSGTNKGHNTQKGSRKCGPMEKNKNINIRKFDHIRKHNSALDYTVNMSVQ